MNKKGQHHGRAEPEREMTYAVQERGGNFIKIGMSSKPWNRIGNLATSHPMPLRVIGIHNKNIEGALHRKLSRWRVHGEWFSCDSPVVRAIAETFDNLLVNKIPWKSGHWKCKIRLTHLVLPGTIPSPKACSALAISEEEAAGLVEDGVFALGPSGRAVHDYYTTASVRAFYLNQLDGEIELARERDVSGGGLFTDLFTPPSKIAVS